MQRQNKHTRKCDDHWETLCGVQSIPWKCSVMFNRYHGNALLCSIYTMETRCGVQSIPWKCSVVFNLYHGNALWCSIYTMETLCGVQSIPWKRSVVFNLYHGTALWCSIYTMETLCGVFKSRNLEYIDCQLVVWITSTTVKWWDLVCTAKFHRFGLERYQ